MLTGFDHAIRRPLILFCCASGRVARKMDVVHVSAQWTIKDARKLAAGPGGVAGGTTDARRQLVVTPGPWAVYDRGIGYEIHDANGQPVNRRFRETFHQDDATFIVAARNIRGAIESGRAPHYGDLCKVFPGLTDEAAPTLTEWLRANTTAPERDRPSHEPIENAAGMAKANQSVPATGEADRAPDAAGDARIRSLKSELTFPDDPIDFTLLEYDPAVQPDEGQWVAELLAKVGSSVGPGWWALIVDCRRSLTRCCPGAELVDVRQRLGGLRISICLSDECAELRDDLHAIVARYQAKSRDVCEATGQPGVLMSDHGYVATRNPITAGAQWRVCTVSPLASAERIKRTPGAVDRLLADLLADNKAAVDERVAGFFAQQRAQKATTTEPEDDDGNTTHD